ncbi:hypothetical protein Tco_1421640, partial [Tanacetum coccineum]
VLPPMSSPSGLCKTDSNRFLERGIGIGIEIGIGIGIGIDIGIGIGIGISIGIGFLYLFGLHRIETSSSTESALWDALLCEFKVVELPYSFTNEIVERVGVSKLRESLVVYVFIKAEEAHCDLWVMEHDSFKKLFIIGTSFYTLLGFSKRGEPIYEVGKSDGELPHLMFMTSVHNESRILGLLE